MKEAEEAAKEEVWAGYRFVALSDAPTGGLKAIDLGAGHSSTNETLCGRIIAALKSEGLLNESVGAGYIDRHWPPAFKETGAWPLTSLRNSFLSGALTRLIDPDTVLRRPFIEFVERGDFGLASGDKGGDLYKRTWYKEPPRAEEIAFESGVFLLTKAKAEELRAATAAPQKPQPGLPLDQSTASDSQPSLSAGSSPIVGPPVQVGQRTTVRLKGTVPPEAWNRPGTKMLPKLRSGDDLSVGIELSVSVDAAVGQSLQGDLRQALAELGLTEQLRVEPS